MTIKINHVLLFFLALTMSSCIKSREEKARELFEESIKPQMGNPEVYEFIHMTELDSAYSSLSIDRTYLALKDSLKNNKTTIYDAAFKTTKDFKAQKKKEKTLEQVIKSYEENFTPKYIGWHSKIEFRAGNIFGGRQIFICDVYFNDDLTRCLDWFVDFK